MALKYKYKTKDEVPEALASHYVERDGSWVLEAEGAAEKARVDTDVALLKELNELKQKFEGIDPEAVRTPSGDSGGCERWAGVAGIEEGLRGEQDAER